MSKSIPLLILESTSSREKVYRFIQFLIRFLSPIQRSPQLNSIYLSSSSKNQLEHCDNPSH